MGSQWRQAKDPLFRGSDDGTPGSPDPAADASIVRHVLYLEGAGRPTPYLSTTEDLSTAERFGHGSVYETTAARAVTAGLGHLSRRELLGLLKGTGKGRASWHSAFEVAQARRYVEEHSEHLLDSTGLAPAAVSGAVSAALQRRR
jgi:hypothetical protein